MDCRGSGSTRYSGELAARAARNIELEKGVATNTGQYAPVFLPGEPQSLTEKPGRLHRVTKSRTLPKPPCAHRCKTLVFACGSSAPVRVKRDGGTAAWLAGALAAPSVQGRGLPPTQELGPY